MNPLEETLRKARIVEALKTCFDPEIPVDIWELGLIYAIETSDDGSVLIRMSLTSPGCMVAQSLPRDVERKVSEVPGVTGARVELVWDPPWSRERMSEDARLALGFA